MRSLGNLSVGLLSVSLLVGFPGALHAKESASSLDLGMEESGVNLGSSQWIPDPASGDLIVAPVGHVSVDPFRYKPVLQCQVGEHIDIKCLPGQLQCPPREPGGKSGTAVIWKLAPRALENPVWTDRNPNDGPSCLYDG